MGDNMISVIIPVYNGEKTIDAVMKSLLQQTFRDFEIIVINDGSTDNTASILEKYNESNIRIINKENGGVGSARNMGIREAKGRYLMFVDADDECRPEMIEKMYFAMLEQKTEFIIGGYERREGSKRIRNIYDNKVYSNKNEIRQDLPYIMSHGLNAPFAKLYIKEIIDHHNLLFDETLPLGEDINFNLEYLLVVDSVLYIESVLYTYQAEKSTATVAYREDYYENRMRSLNRINAILDKYNLENPIQGYMRTKLIYAEMFNLLKRQCPLYRKSKYKRIGEIKKEYISSDIHVVGKWRLLKWQIHICPPFILYSSAFLLQKIVKRIPEKARGISV